MHRQFKAVGISYRNTPLEVREAVTFDEKQAKQFMLQLKDVLGIEEAMILSTCNRTEVYYSSPEDLSNKIASLIDVFHGLVDQPAAGYFEEMAYDEAVSHLFEVSLGVDSQVLGDIQITNQVKKAYQWSADEDMAGPFLHRLLHTIFFTNKRTVQETAFRDGTASVASAAVDIAGQFMHNYTAPQVAVIGLGEIGSNVAENLKGSGADVCLVNRTFETAQSKAEEFGHRAVAYERLQEVVQSAHVVISAVQAPEPVITTDLLAGNQHPKMLIDLSVPRSIEEAVEEINGVLLYNVDHLQERASQALKRRHEAVGQVQAIIAESIAEFNNWSQEMEVSPTIKRFKQALEDIRKEELARYVGKMDDKQAKLLEKATKNMMQKVIKLPVLQLKAACKRGEAETLVGVLNDLFNLEQEETKSAE